MLLAFLLLALQAPADPALFDAATGYRTARYRAVVPAPPEGVTRIGVDEVRALHAKGAPLIDVTPAEGAIRDPASGHWRLAMPHDSLPGAHWFPEAGRGVPAAGIESWFVMGVARVTHGSKARPLVVFCLADCWMSWNAALRLHRAGYVDVRWFADGIDGWKEAGLPVKRVVPAR
ncbi:rhodanese [Sphingomonas naphthae]|uniref:Rhodanese n=1 Tax=Sphingomonas naphthae TaxID=1813468 RepID=A0ABY7TKG9_9SPHN|nr:rhodanese-like domain-containing protein [Sphingomonas naphthae]WCT73212.1 rhodanese [Sphingomonas naphthae]